MVGNGGLDGGGAQSLVRGRMQRRTAQHRTPFDEKMTIFLLFLLLSLSPAMGNTGGLEEYIPALQLTASFMIRRHWIHAQYHLFSD